MELEEAKKILYKYLNFNEILGTRNLKEAIETVLQAQEEINNKYIFEKTAKEEVEELLENSVSKDVIKEEKEKHLDYLLNSATTSNPTLDANFRIREKYAIQVLEELLEGK